MHRLRHTAARSNRDLTKEERNKCKKDAIAFDDYDCVTKTIDYLLTLKREPKKLVDRKIVGNRLQMHAHNGSGL